MRTFALMLTALFALSASASDESPKIVPEQTDAMVVHENIVYSEGNEVLKMDLFLPKEVAKPVPCIVVIQGGGFSTRDGKGFRSFAEYLAKNGFAAALVGYRGLPDYTYETTVDDLKTAVRFVRSVSRQYDIDPNRIGAMGRSAGATLAVLLTVTGDSDLFKSSGQYQNSSDRIQAAVGIAGVYDFVARFADDSQRGLQPQIEKKLESNGQWIGTPFATNDGKWRKVSAINHIDASDSPILLLHSRNDPTVPWLQSEKMYHALTEAGVAAEIEISETGKHGGPPDSKERMVAFFREAFGN